ncbi:flagellar filament capping protein FliD [Frigoriglobus tundricola]|uniref:Flagellar hook-associated protein 2 n=1 Tax=Frigoriglobus tundricola TaxID=2774151 RepID=A0A6M5YX10_9BACT|nr:flagellar filament capping protein FliD [Frigoriglobus tundricola]QJW98004.1 hypothetical protein FTUN_5584 [Frigoriglobus tundricola]
MSAISSASSGTAAGSTSSTSSAVFQITGLSSGIDTSSIITALTKFNTQQITQLQSQQATITAKQGGWTTIQTDLTNLQTAANALANSNGAFNSFTATAANATAITAAAGSSAVAGTYTLSVNALAQGEQVASQGFSDPNATIQQGTFSVQVGTGAATTVTVNSNNNTLQGLADALNQAGGDVSAAVINDGSGTPYRLLLTSSKTGAANTITVTNNLTSGTGAAIDATNTVIQPAADARVTIGSGSGALTVTSASNQLHSLIPGVSLNLLSTTSQPTTLTVAGDTTAAVTAVQNFVTAYNQVRDDIGTLTKYDPSGTNSGVLLGNSDAVQLQSALSDLISSPVAGVKATADDLTAAGLSFTNSGDLALNTTTLTNALTGQTPGVTATDIQNLFALSGSTDNPGVQFITGGASTLATAGAPYQVNITSPATRATLAATAAPAASTTIDSTNNTLAVQVNGIAATVTLTPGTYTATQLTAQLQQQINGASALANNPVAVSLSSSGNIQITSQEYGSGSGVAITGGTAASALGFSGNPSASGTNVAGNFVVNGKTEPANGFGQFLVGATTNANTAGLEVQATLTSPGGANVTVNQGLAAQLNVLVNSYLTPSTGKLATINSAYTTQISNITTQITQDNNAVSQKTAQLQTEFSQMETAINSLKTIQNQLSAFGVYSYSTGTTSYSSSSSSSSGK